MENKVVRREERGFFFYLFFFFYHKGEGEQREWSVRADTTHEDVWIVNGRRPEETTGTFVHLDTRASSGVVIRELYGGVKPRSRDAAAPRRGG